MEQQVDPIIKTYFDLIKANAGSFRSYYYGDPVRIPASSLPALIGTRRATSTTWSDSANDEHTMELVFTVVIDIRPNISDDTTLVPGWNALFDLVEGRDPDTLLLKSQSLLNILRHNFAPANNLWTSMRTPTRVEYGLVANKRQPGQWSIEAAITTAASFIQLR